MTNAHIRIGTSVLDGDEASKSFSLHGGHTHTRPVSPRVLELNYGHV